MRKRKLRKAAAVILALSMMFPAQAIAAGGVTEVTKETGGGQTEEESTKVPENGSEDSDLGNTKEDSDSESETMTEQETTEEDEIGESQAEENEEK